MLKIVLTLTVVLGLATALSACGDDPPPAPAWDNSDTGRCPHSHQHSIAHPGAHGPAHAYPVCGANGHADSPTDTYAYVSAYRDTGSYAHGYPNPCAYAYPNVHADGYAGSHTYCRAHSDTYTTNAHTYPTAHSALFLACRWGDGGREESDSLVGRHRSGGSRCCEVCTGLPLACRWCDQ